MALPADSVFEYQTGGNNNNGGGYAASYGGTDYSQSTTPILDLATWSCTAGSTTITTSSGGLTAAMVGNVWNLHTPNGTSNVAGLYMITAITDANTMTIDRSIGPSAMTNGTGRIGGCLAIPLDAHFETFVAGNIVWFKYGQYTFTQAVSVASTSATGINPITVLGFNSTRGDIPSGTYRPLFNMAAYYISYGAHWITDNIRHLSARTNNVGTSYSNSARAYNCYYENTYNNASSSALAPGSASEFILCEVKSQYSYAIATADGAYFDFCYIHDSLYGASVSTNNRMHFHFCLFDSNTTHIICSATRQLGILLAHCIFYGGTTGISLAGALNSTILLCVFKDITTAITDSSQNNGAKILNCFFHGCTTNGTNVTIDSTNVTGSDPLFTDASNGDFTIQAGSPLLNAGFDLLRIGLTGSYKINAGIDQDDNTITGAPFFGWVA